MKTIYDEIKEYIEIPDISMKTIENLGIFKEYKELKTIDPIYLAVSRYIELYGNVSIRPEPDLRDFSIITGDYINNFIDIIGLYSEDRFFDKFGKLLNADSIKYLLENNKIDKSFILSNLQYFFSTKEVGKIMKIRPESGKLWTLREWDDLNFGDKLNLLRDDRVVLGDDVIVENIELISDIFLDDPIDRSCLERHLTDNIFLKLIQKDYLSINVISLILSHADEEFIETYWNTLYEACQRECSQCDDVLTIVRKNYLSNGSYKVHKNLIIKTLDNCGWDNDKFILLNSLFGSTLLDDLWENIIDTRDKLEYIKTGRYDENFLKKHWKEINKLTDGEILNYPYLLLQNLSSEFIDEYWNYTKQNDGTIFVVNDCEWSIIEKDRTRMKLWKETVEDILIE